MDIKSMVFTLSPIKREFVAVNGGNMAVFS